MTKKDIVAGLGEIGYPIFQLFLQVGPTLGYDKDPKQLKQKNLNLENLKTFFLHICIPYTKNFLKDVTNLSKKFKPDIIVIHSTISPYTTKQIQQSLDIPIIYSATRGIHKRMLKDLKRYTKFFSIYDWAPKSNWAKRQYSLKLKKAGVKSKKMSSPLVLEFAKIVVDTSYYGWLINYAQLSNMIAIQNNLDYDEMWSFADEIHKFLGNRPMMFPGFIGGHCVLPNLDLMHNQTLNLIKKMNDDYLKKVPNAKHFNKKYKN